MKEKHFYYFKHWFVFPLSITIHARCPEYKEQTSIVELHFLWWHWKWTIRKGGE